MEGFTYTNIFETKGIEYLIIIGFFAILIPFWLLLNRKTKLSQQLSNAVGKIMPNSLKVPQGVFFSKFHTWAHLGINGEARIGLDDLLLHFTGDVNFEYIKSPGEHINKGEILTLINHNGKTLRILSPISGEIKGTNTRLRENPGLIKEDPYRQGWIYSIKPVRWKAETNSYFLAEEATYWAKQEMLRFKDFLSMSVAKYMPEPGGVVLQDGGELIDQPLAELPQEVWQDFEDKFLR